MSFEPFTDASGGTNFWKSDEFKADSLPVGFTKTHMQFAIYKCAHTFKLFIRVVLLILIIYMIWIVATYILNKVFGIKVVGAGCMKPKEGLQYLGASADVVRSDLENPVDSLAEKALASQTTSTNMPSVTPATPAKQAFTEHLVTPEEKEMANIKKTLKLFFCIDVQLFFCIDVQF